MYAIREVDGKTIEPLLVEFDLQMFPDSPRITPSVGWWWLVYAGDDCVGYAGYQPSKSWLETGYLCRAAVDPKHRGNGIQKRLIRIRCAHAKRQGMKHMITDTHCNPPSANSLIACGFRIYEPQSPWAFPASIYWRKYL